MAAPPLLPALPWLHSLRYVQDGAESAAEFAAGLPLLELALATTLAVEGFEFLLERLQQGELAAPAPPAVLLEVVARVPAEEGERDLAGALAEGYGPARAYSQAKLRFSMFSRIVDVALTVFTLSQGILPLMWDVAAGLLRLSVVAGMPAPPAAYAQLAHSLAFLVVFQLWNTALSAPLSLYKQFVLEEEHGFNKMTVPLWVADRARSLALQALLGLPVAAAVLTVVEAAGEGFHNWLFALVVLLQLAAQVVIPVFVMPCFNTFEPLPEGALKTRIETLAGALGFPLQRLSVMDGSKRSSHSNAFFIGLPCLPKRIVLFDTLVEQASDDEIVAVLAHELGHWAHNHTLALQALGLALTYGQLAAFATALHWAPMYAAFGFVDTPPVVGMLLFFSFAFQPLSPLLSFALSALSRACEFDADAFAAAQGGKDGCDASQGAGMGRALQTCLVKLSLDNKSPQRAHWLYSAFNYSHPPLPERLAALQAGTAAAGKRGT